MSSDLQQARAEAGHQLATMAREGVSVFREENPAAYQELVHAFEGRSADLALLGKAGFHVAVEKGELLIEPNSFRGDGARGAATSETLLAILEGRLTPLEAFFKGDLMVRAKSPDLHLAYDYFVKFADATLRSNRLRALLGRFRDTFGEGGEPAAGGRH